MEGKIPDGIIRAYRKTIRAKNSSCDLKFDESFKWIEGVMWELIKLYPDLTKLPEEE
jgi:hypothetical protein